ncbi:hypothetical protein KIL84_004678, partial [Mauremys mutica]
MQHFLQSQRKRHHRQQTSQLLLPSHGFPLEAMYLAHLCPQVTAAWTEVAPKH